MKPAIEIRNLGKKYKLNATEPYVALRDVIAGSFRSKAGVTKKESFWALQDINLDIMPGERIGIIGRNGAGKSTLLKIISRITPPTTGSAIMRGRVGSLLEVGTGFHPELTGRENIYLNGSILGLRKMEIDKKLDEIISFSGVEKFIDTPLKHFSSGMQLRLAFSVAAHLEPEILLIDEVLAVGDLEFQKKCMGKMEEISQQQGRTILFVSHNMNYVAGLCERAILLNEGKLISTGGVREVITKYTSGVMQTSPITSNGNGIVRLRKLETITRPGQPQDHFNVNEMIGVQMEYEVLQDGHVLWAGYNIYNQDGINVFDSHSVSSPYYKTPHDKGIYSAIAWIPGNLLNSGNYLIGCAVFNHSEHVIYFQEKNIGRFTVNDIFGDDTSRGDSPGDFPGVVRPLLNWEISKK